MFQVCAEKITVHRINLLKVQKTGSGYSSKWIRHISNSGPLRDNFKVLFKGLFTRKEGYPCARVTLASGLKLALAYKQISQVELPYHSLSPGSTLPALLTCFVMRDILCNVQDLK